MEKEWVTGSDGENLKFKRETLLNYGMNRWGLNKAHKRSLEIHSVIRTKTR